jgi:hypothetical protein
MSRFLCLAGWSLLCTAPLWAQEAAKPPAAADAKEKDRPIRLYLLEGSMVSGKLSVESLTVETEFGKLEVPVDKIVSFTPGMDHRPDERQKIGRLIQQLGANVAAERDAAQKALTEMGSTIRGELERHAKDDDAERRSRIQKILTELAEQEEDGDRAVRQALIPQDTLETTLFTVVGKISPQQFAVQTPFGQLTLALRDIRRAERETEETPEVRKSLQVTGAHFVQISFAESGVRLNRGDKVQVTADGKLTMTPWGNNAVSGPDGDQRYQWYIQPDMPSGTLIGRIGTGGKVFKVGSKHTFTADRAGQLYFAIAMNPQFINQGHNFPGEYNVKVRVNSK